MKKPIFVLLAIVALALNSCRMPREMLWDMMVMPFSGMDKEQVHNIDKFMPDCPLVQFEFDAQYDDSLKQNERYFLNTQSAQKDPIRLYKHECMIRPDALSAAMRFAWATLNSLKSLRTCLLQANMSR